MLSIKQKNIEVVAATIVISVMLIAGQIEANTEEEAFITKPKHHTNINDTCCINTGNKVNSEQAKELTFGTIQCPSIPLTVTLSTINEQIEVCLLHEKRNTLKHILNNPPQQVPLVQHKNNKLPKAVNSKTIDTFYKAPEHIRF